jgi:hypothetical protein
MLEQRWALICSSSYASIFYGCVNLFLLEDGDVEKKNLAFEGN